MGKSLYDILQVARAADPDVIAAAYERLRERLENATDERGQLERKAIDEAYATLRDPARRAAYDRRVTPLEPVRYQSDAANAFDDWWRGRRVLGVLIAMVFLAGTGMALKYGLDSKAASDRVKVEEQRADTEAETATRVVDNLDRRVDVQRDALQQHQDLARVREQRAREQTLANIEAQQHRTDLQRRDQEIRARQAEITEQQRLAAEERRQASFNEAANRRQLERDREELCRLEALRYNRPISCAGVTITTTAEPTGVTTTRTTRPVGR